MKYAIWEDLEFEEFHTRNRRRFVITDQFLTIVRLGNGNSFYFWNN